MKPACLFLLSLLSLAVSVRGYGGRGFNPLKQHLNSPRAKDSANHVLEDSSNKSSSHVYVGNQDGLKTADKISSLPGQPKVSFSQYSGHVTVDPAAGRALFYYFTESESPSDKPLVLWLTGGPGCSSLGAGAMTELGPFRVNSDRKTLWRNNNSWNKVANVIFLESPAGVGFSYSNRTKDYHTGDDKTAEDTYTFLINWLERFPEYKKRDFYITGESYAGHYVPQLAALILRQNQTIINLKGVAIGNAYIDRGDNTRGTYDFYYTHALIPYEIHQGIVNNCNFSTTYTKKCRHYTDLADNAVDDIFPYNIYAPLCGLDEDEDKRYAAPAETSPSVSIYDPCSDYYVETYLNRPEVQKALHANTTKIPGPWKPCSDGVVYEPNDIKATVIATIKGLMGSGIRIWIYSGDTDAVVSITATEYSLSKIGAKVKTPWYPWYIQKEVGGYAVGYENLTFVSVKGAGHFVPSYQPERALILFSSFLEGKLPPKKKK